MRTARTFLALIASIVASGGGTASAATAPATVAAAAPERSLNSFGAGVSSVVGAGTPVGLLGVEGRLDPVRWFFLTAGVGVGEGGVQLATMAHLRMPLSSIDPNRQVAVSAGYGLSRGEHKWDSGLADFCFCADPNDYAHKEGILWWHNMEVALEVRLRFATPPVVVVGFFGGLAVAGNADDIHCVGNNLDRCERQFADAGYGPLPYFGASLGFWFH